MSDCFDHMADAWDDCLFGATHYDLHYDSSNRAPRDTHVRCRYCGGSAWWRYKDGWKLYNVDGAQHLCRVTAASADEFDDLS